MSNKGRVNKVNALRDAQLQGIDLLMWQKFGYGKLLFQRYYQMQNILEDEEWSLFEETIERELPLTFRVHASHPLRKQLLAKLLKLDVTNIPWMPDNTGFLANVDTRSAVKKSSLGQWLALAVSSGAAARQVQTSCHFTASNVQCRAMNRGSRQSKRTRLLADLYIAGGCITVAGAPS